MNQPPDNPVSDQTAADKGRRFIEFIANILGLAITKNLSGVCSLVSEKLKKPYRTVRRWADGVSTPHPNTFQEIVNLLTLSGAPPEKISDLTNYYEQLGDSEKRTLHLRGQETILPRKAQEISIDDLEALLQLARNLQRPLPLDFALQFLQLRQPKE